MDKLIPPLPSRQRTAGLTGGRYARLDTNEKGQALRAVNAIYVKRGVPWAGFPSES